MATNDRLWAALLAASFACGCSAASSTADLAGDEPGDPGRSAEAAVEQAIDRCSAFDDFAGLWSAPGQDGAHRYVSPNGDDGGDGSRTRPWRRIGSALDQTLGVRPIVHVAPGVYREGLIIERSLSILRDDFEQSGGEVVLQQPLEGAWLVEVVGRIEVSLDGLVIDGELLHSRGIFVSQSRVTLSRVVVETPRGYGIVIEDSPRFRLTDSTVTMNGLSLHADIAVDLQRSRGIVARLTAGHLFDHIVNVAGEGSLVAIVESTLTGSSVHYADGIRVQSAADVLIVRNRIERPEGNAAGSGGMHNPPYAGIELASGTDEGRCAIVSQNRIRGFDVGIGVNLIGNRLLAEDNLVEDNQRAQVQTTAAASELDFGGGPLASAGHNLLSGGIHAFEHAGAYDVPAEGNRWGGAAEERILDALDDPARGLVQHGAR